MPQVSDLLPFPSLLQMQDTHIRRRGRQTRRKEKGAAGVESGANPDRVHTHSQFEAEVDKSLMSHEMAHFEINFVPRLNLRTFPPNFHCAEYVLRKERLRSKAEEKFIAYMHFTV